MKNAGHSLVLLSALLLAGCSSPTVGPGHGPGVNSVEKILKSYKQTIAGAKGGPATFDAAQKAGLEGFGAGTTTTQAAADLVGTFKTGKVTGDASKLTVTVDGHTYTIPASSSFPPKTITDSNGHKLFLSIYGATHTVPMDDMDAEAFYGNVAEQFGIDDAALTIFVKNLSGAYDSDAGVWNSTFDGYSIIATGRETSASALPTTLATYGGFWILISGVNATSASSSSTFTTGGYLSATVDFTAKSVALAASNYNNDATGPGDSTYFSGTGKLLPGTNKFTAAVSGSQFDGTVAGGFYGTEAQQIAGVGNGQSNGKGAVIGFVGTQSLGTPTP